MTSILALQTPPKNKIALLALADSAGCRSGAPRMDGRTSRIPDCNDRRPKPRFDHDQNELRERTTPKNANESKARETEKQRNRSARYVRQQKEKHESPIGKQESRLSCADIPNAMDESWTDGIRCWCDSYVIRESDTMIAKDEKEERVFDQ